MRLTSKQVKLIEREYHRARLLALGRFRDVDPEIVEGALHIALVETAKRWRGECDFQVLLFPEIMKRVLETLDTEHPRHAGWLPRDLWKQVGCSLRDCSEPGTH